MPNKVKNVPKVTIDEPKPITGRIAWHIENTLVRVVKIVFNAIASPFRSMIAFAFEEFFDLLEPHLLQAAGPSFDTLLNSPNVPDYIKSAVSDAKAGKSANNWFVAIGCIISFILSIGAGFTAPFTRLIQYEIEQSVLSHIPDPATIVAMSKTGAVLPTNIDEEMKRLGIRDDYREGYKRLFTKFLSVGEMAQAIYRKEFDETYVTAVLKRQGLDELHIKAFFEIIKVIPSVQDLIRMQVREAWDDNIAKEFGYDDGDYSEFARWIEKQGLDAEWAKRYWRSHWELPGIQSGFEMLHREIIDEDQLKLLMRARDIPSFWRKSLIKLSYRPYTRVDVRRMYTAGVLDEEEVLRAYKDIGYNEERAQKMTEWTIQEFPPTEGLLSKAEVYRLFVEGVINENEAINYYEQLDIVSDVYRLYLERAKLQIQKNYETEYVENVRLSFVGRKIGKDEVISRLNQLAPPAGFVEDKLSIWELQQERAIELPTKADIKAFLLNNVIDEARARYYLSRRDYENETIDEFIRLWQQTQ